MPRKIYAAALCVDFLRNFVDEQDSSKYMKQLARIVERTRQLLEVNLDDLQGVHTAHFVA